jgi:hypothetical protein
MNIPRIRRPVLLLLLLACLTLVRADDGTRDGIVKERDAVLSEILAGREQRFAVGGGDDESVRAARLALLSFRRDVASTAGEKIRQQELIVEMWRKRLATVENQVKSGLAGRETVLVATDSLLQARQLLAEIRAQEVKK